MRKFIAKHKRSESGFSLIELLVVVAILGLLAQLSITAFFVYMGKAEFAKADSLYVNARTAATAGEDDLGAAFAMAYTETADNGGGLVGNMADLFPNLSLPVNVVLGASIDACPGATMDPRIVLVVKPCKGPGKHIEYVQLCNGVETIDRNAAGNGC